MRVHDLKHTFGRRLRAAGVSGETRKVLLGHKNGDITTHHSAAELAELITAVSKIDRSLETPAITLLRVAAWAKVSQQEIEEGVTTPNPLKKVARPEGFKPVVSRISNECVTQRHGGNN